MQPVQSPAVPPGAAVFYASGVLSPDGEARLVEAIGKQPRPVWKTVKPNTPYARRLQMWGGIVTRAALVPDKLPPFLSELMRDVIDPAMAAVLDAGKRDTKHTGEATAPDVDAHAALEHLRNAYKPPNHVLINEYEPGQGIFAHFDGPAYLPYVATLSLGCHTMLEFFASSRGGEEQVNNPDVETSAPTSKQQAVFKLLLEPNSIVVLTGAAYTDYLHGIAHNVTSDNVTWWDVRQGTIANLPLTGYFPKVMDIVKSTKEGEKLKDDTTILCIKRSTTRLSLTCRHVPKVISALNISKIVKR